MRKILMITITAGSVFCFICSCGSREPERSEISVTPIIVEDITGQEMGFLNTDASASDTDQGKTNPDSSDQEAPSDDASKDAVRSDETTDSDSTLPFLI